MPQPGLPLAPVTGPAHAVSPLLDLGAYEVLWSRPGASFRSIADLFREHPDALPSDLVDHGEAREMAREVVALLEAGGVTRFGVRIHRAGEYPARLRDARDPVELLYFQGWWSYVESPSVAVVGARKASEEGIRRARRLARELVEDGWTVVSGLAAGIDTAAHTAALDAGGRTVAVIGTPLSEVYPRENRELQRRIARDFLVISQVPVYRHSRQDWRLNRHFFPARNVTMAALTEATVIVEASDTSGTLTQARAALAQGRRLFILESCFQVPGLTWPSTYEQLGAVRVRDYDDIRRDLPGAHRD
jgi:DNA processing protein